ncbi:MAG: serine/threonine protein kinase, partial [Planctomycetes bacterium]|nr:serine/threonine protein kinase [Planctomycetota bacterium]
MDDRDRQPESDVAREQLHAIDRLCTEYDRHWRRWQQGEEQLRPRIEDYLAQAPEDIRCRVLIDLIAQDYDLRSAAGEVVDVADYRQRFPAYGQWVEEALKQRAAAMPHPAGASASLADTTDASHLKSPREDAGTTGLPDHFGRYVVRELIGKGGFGAVYLAHDPDLKRLVAVKVPRLGPDGTLHGSIEQFIHEAQTAASLRHPGIVAIHDVLRGADHVAIVQEYIAGQDLRHWMHGRRCEPVKAAEIILKVVETLTFAHSQGFIHRDLKPGNILLDDGDCVHLADFGLAVHAGELGQRGATSGTPAYMSPEQVRGETHRLDGRSDIWSVGVILYELLTSSRPFRGETADELYTAIVRDDPWPPRQIRPDVPAELDRICIKCLAKRASDRFASAADLADDLRIGLETGFADRSRTRRDEEPRPAREAAAIVPKGLRPFGREDADFFLDLLPGPRDRTGLPDSVRFWKTRIEAPRAEESFPVGILYGPSGCGKSSLVMAGLLPCLSSRVATVYLDATHADTEAHVRRAIGETVPHAPRNVNLTRLLLELREGRHLAADQKLLIVLDQFEQWLHAHPAENGCELRDALRQCDGARVQAMLLVRDDFWLATSRFMQSVEVPVREGTNARAVDLFDSLHARKLLLTFGRAHGRLPEREDELSADQREFVRLAVEGLLEDDKVVCVRLALLVDMFKGREWTPANLKHVGGISGLGVTFLEELFDAASASQRHRVHREAAARVLQALLPEPGSTLKGRLRSRAELLAMSGYEHRPPDFDQLMLMLDRELRLVTPAAREDGSTAGEHTFYQLTHDYLVAPLRQWVHRRTKATRAGRAALSLAEREAEWTVRRETRRLPGFWEFVRIAAFTRHRDWTANQRAMMRRAALHHVTRLAVVAAVLAAAAWGLHAHQVSRSSEVNAIVQALATADTSEVPRLLEQLEPLRRRAHPLLMKLLSESPPGSRQRLHASLALLPFDGFQMEYLLTCIGAATPAEAQVLGEQSAPFASRLRTDILQRLEVALANGDGLLPLAVFSSATPVKPDWDRIAPAVVKQLVSLDVRAVDGWANALRPARTHLRPALEAVYRDATNGYSDQQRAIAAEILVEYLEGDFEPLANLLLDASASQFKVVYPAVERQPDALADYLASRTEGEPPRVWNDLPLDARWPAVTAKIAAEVESADGMVHERFAMCQTMA